MEGPFQNVRNETETGPIPKKIRSVRPLTMDAVPAPSPVLGNAAPGTAYPSGMKELLPLVLQLTNSEQVCEMSGGALSAMYSDSDCHRRNRNRHNRPAFPSRLVSSRLVPDLVISHSPWLITCVHVSLCVCLFLFPCPLLFLYTRFRLYFCRNHHTVARSCPVGVVKKTRVFP